MDSSSLSRVSPTQDARCCRALGSWLGQEVQNHNQTKTQLMDCERELENLKAELATKEEEVILLTCKRNLLLVRPPIRHELTLTLVGMPSKESGRGSYSHPNGAKSHKVLNTPPPVQVRIASYSLGLNLQSYNPI